MYFRYRGATKGAEQFCYGILDADNVPRRRFFEVQNFFREVRPYEQALSAPVHSDVAILYDLTRWPPSASSSRASCWTARPR